MFEVRGVPAVDVDRLGYEAAISLLADVERQAAVLAGLAMALIHRAEQAVDPTWAPAVADDVALASRISSNSARLRMHTAADLAGPLAPIGAALATGAISLLQALAVAGETAWCPDPVAAAVAARITDVLPDLAPGQARTRTRRLIAELDPAGVAQRMAERLAERAVSVRDYGDGVGELAGVGTAERLTAAYAAVRALAATYDDDRRAAAKEADAFFELLTGQPARPDPDDPADGPADAAAASPTPPVPAPLPEHAPADADPDAQPTDSLPDPPADLPLPDPTTRRAPDPTPPLAPTRRPPAPPPAVRVLIDLPTLLGLAEHPGHLDGYGPIPAPLARALAADGTWQRLVTDPLTGTALDLGRRRYRPTTALTELVRARDRHCAFPRCTRAIAQIDHRLPYGDGGRTDADNLTGLCEPHHHGKTKGYLTYTRNPDGSYTWHTKGGQTGRTPPPQPDD